VLKFSKAQRMPLFATVAGQAARAGGNKADGFHGIHLCFRLNNATCLSYCVPASTPHLLPVRCVKVKQLVRAARALDDTAVHRPVHMVDVGGVANAAGEAGIPSARIMQGKPGQLFTVCSAEITPSTLKGNLAKKFSYLLWYYDDAGQAGVFGVMCSK